MSAPTSRNNTPGSAGNTCNRLNISIAISELVNYGVWGSHALVMIRCA
jgi:hypothetical protein